MFYNFDIYKWGLLLLPPVLRRKRLYALLTVLLKPLYDVLQRFNDFREDSIQRMNINGQVIYIEKALNDRFMLEYHEIYITDATDALEASSLLYPESDVTMKVYGAESDSASYIYGAYEVRTGINFIVNIPSFLSGYVDEIKTIIEYNKPAGRSYKINMYDYE